MLTYEDLSPAQERWVALIETFYPEVYAEGFITHKQLIQSHAKFLEMREESKKFTVGWPIWLITNNATSRGVYLIPKEEKVDSAAALGESFADYEKELAEFNVS